MFERWLIERGVRREETVTDRLISREKPSRNRHVSIPIFDQLEMNHFGEDLKKNRSNVFIKASQHRV